MIYLAGDNNLTDASVYAMTEMKKVGSDNGVNIITQFDPKDYYLPTHRYHIGREDDGGQVMPLASDIIDTSKAGAFKGESVSARNHENVRRAARRRAKEAAIEEARKVARTITVAGSEPMPETVLLESEDEPSISAHDTDTGSPVTLYNFMSTCVEMFPAKHYMVVLAGHGSGTNRDFLLKDESPAGSLTINELKRAFEELSPELGDNRKIDILGMDTCLMSMAEVAYELRGLVKILIGSESYSPVSGWPYEPILRMLKDEIAGTSEEEEAALEETERIEFRVARAIVKAYVNFYADYWLGGLSVDQSALNVDAVEELKAYVDEFAGAMSAALNDEVKADQTRRLRDDLILAHWEAQSYNGELFVDLFDFCDCLLKRQQEGRIFETGSQLMKFIKSTFVLKSCYSGPIYQYSYGVSIYFPWSNVEDDYGKLDFIGKKLQTGWGKFLREYTSLTRRAPRPVEQADQNFLLKVNRDIGRFRQTQGRGPEGQNPVRSMRNPPIYAEPEACIDGREELAKGLHRIFNLQ
jgi:hypothetical protein